MLDSRSQRIANINSEVDKLIQELKNELNKRSDELKAEGIGIIYYNMEWHDTAYLWIYDKDNKFSVDTWEFTNEELIKYIDGLVQYCDEIRNYLWLARTSINDYRLTLWEDN